MSTIEFKNVSKYFKIYQNKSYSIKEKFINKILRRNKLEVQKYDVLKDVSFKIEEGETIGIIGENGTGKSTSLKLISKILYPDSGEIIVNGKVSSLLEIGAGFQPDLTGRENVYLYGSILGLRQEEIQQKYNEIVEFAEIEQFMDTAVKNYSSGMYMRLAFAVAINVEPDILIIDEVLAVGDESFQKKCINKILDFKKKGKTIVFVSHDMTSIKRLCDRVLFIKRGGKVIEGSSEELIGLYLKYVYSNEQDRTLIDEDTQNDKKVKIRTKDECNFDLHEAKEFIDGVRFGNKELEIKKVYFSSINGIVKNIFETGEDIKVNVEYIMNGKTDGAVLGFAIHSEENWHLCGPNCKQNGVVIRNIQAHNMLNFTIKNNPFLKGKYYLTVALFDESCVIPYDFREKHYYFQVVESDNVEYGKIRLVCEWNVGGEGNGAI